jgi:hypothetical protein
MYAPFLSCHDLGWCWLAMAGVANMATAISAAEKRSRQPTIISANSLSQPGGDHAGHE